VSELLDETTELTQQLIRNACVNDGSPTSGNETKSAEMLASYFDGSGVDVEVYEPLPGRGSLVATIEGSDPAAPTLLLMGHTDVVPVNEDDWQRDPFGGDLVDGEVWGRGAIDMLCLTGSMAVAVRHLATAGWRPRGTLKYLAVADEEAGGGLGARWLLAHEADAVRADYCITEAGGFDLPLTSAGGPKLPVMVAEKGVYWCTLRARGTPGHGSRPFRGDNALVKAAEIIRRLSEYRPATVVPDVWRRFVDGMELAPELAAALLDPNGIGQICETAPDASYARFVHASTHTSIAPTMMRAGTKANVIPDRARLQLDIRTLPGQTENDVEALLADALGDLVGSIEVHVDTHDPSTASPVQTPLWDTMQRVSSRLVPGAQIVPFLATGASDARLFRALGTASYGFSLFSERLSFTDYSARVHGDDERIDQASLGLCADLWPAVARDLLDAS
jgi:acetylornithine deacetylase/succinyl-diaminopimelate desuccinylase-like protein